MNSTPIDTYAGQCIHGVPYGPGWSCGLCPNAAETSSPTQTILVSQAFCGGCAALRDTRAEAARLAEQLEAADAKLAEREEEIELLREALAGMLRQFAYWTADGGLTTGGLSALENAFDALGWDDPHPDPAGRCEEPGCMRQRSCGMPTPDGYRWLCGEHYRLARRADR